MAQAGAVTVRKQVVVDAPIERALVFSWDISPQWTIETDQAHSSEVEVRFYAESPTPMASTAPRAGPCTWTDTPRY